MAMLRPCCLLGPERKFRPARYAGDAVATRLHRAVNATSEVWIVPVAVRHTFLSFVSRPV